MSPYSVAFIVFITSSSAATANCFTEIKQRIADSVSDKLVQVCKSEHSKNLDYAGFNSGVLRFLNSAEFNWSVECSNQCESSETANECSNNFVERNAKKMIVAMRKRDEIVAICSY